MDSDSSSKAEQSITVNQLDVVFHVVMSQFTMYQSSNKGQLEPLIVFMVAFMDGLYSECYGGLA